MHLPFDSVRFTNHQGVRTLDPAEFLALPLKQRVHALLEDRIEFLSGGEPIPSGIALRALHTQSLAAAG